MDDKPISKGRSTAYSKIYATNVLVSETDSDVRLYGFNEILKRDKNENIAISDGEIVLTRSATVLLYEQLEKLIEEWNSSNRKPEVSDVRRNTLKKLLEGF